MSSNSAIQVSGYDLGRKAALYASFGVAELWVIDAVQLVTHIHREPSPTGYKSIVEHNSTQRLKPSAALELAVVLAELELV